MGTPSLVGRQCWGKTILPGAGYGLGTYRTVDIFNFSHFSWTILEKLRFLCFYIHFGPKKIDRVGRRGQGRSKYGTFGSFQWEMCTNALFWPSLTPPAKIGHEKWLKLKISTVLYVPSPYPAPGKMVFPQHWRPTSDGVSEDKVIKHIQRKCKSVVDRMTVWLFVVDRIIFLRSDRYDGTNYMRCLLVSEHKSESSQHFNSQNQQVRMLTILMLIIQFPILLLKSCISNTCCK